MANSFVHVQLASSDLDQSQSFYAVALLFELARAHRPALLFELARAHGPGMIYTLAGLRRNRVLAAVAAIDAETLAEPSCQI
ncbi:MAG: hypothetical protein JO095_14460 [Alphaproteobacteria bacterium]|nr:hypothetical protein [Alphaproteobacteria bacterium]MBV9199912.1 hypothetical protein [Alphaproteobacteria bacterium]MBV9816669.1 hypothetical protein [Alphaproteobacteria bacterium]